MNTKNKVLFGVFLISLGALLLLDQFDFLRFESGTFFVLLLIMTGVTMIINPAIFSFTRYDPTSKEEVDAKKIQSTNASSAAYDGREQESLRRYLCEDDEKIVGVLSNRYITNLLQGRLEKNTIILTNKRIYHRGKIFEKLRDGKLSSFAGSKIVSLRDVTGVGFHKYTPMWLLISIIYQILTCVMLAAMLVLLSGSNTNESATITKILMLILGLLLISCLVSVVRYFFARNNFFVIEYSGGEISTFAKWYSERDVEEFQKKIVIQAQIYKEPLNSKSSAESQKAEC